MTTAKRFWAAVPTSVYRDNVRNRGSKVYYNMHGAETFVADHVGSIVQYLVDAGAATGDTEYTVFKYVPSPSSMHAALWSVLHDAPEDQIPTFDVRVHEKFSFPSANRGADMANPEHRPSQSLAQGENPWTRLHEGVGHNPLSHLPPAEVLLDDVMCELESE